MPNRFGLLLPRSTDYPAMGYDIMEGLVAGLKKLGFEDYRLCTENIGFGTDGALNYAKAEKLFLEENVEMIIAYSNPLNAEPLYALAEAMQKPLIILDQACNYRRSIPHTPIIFRSRVYTPADWQDKWRAQAIEKF